MTAKYVPVHCTALSPPALSGVALPSVPDSSGGEVGLISPSFRHPHQRHLLPACLPRLFGAGGEKQALRGSDSSGSF